MGNKNRARNLSFGTCSFLGLARDASCVAHYENRVARDENRVERVVTFLWAVLYTVHQGGKRLGDETSSPLFKRCVMQRRTGTSALSALPVRLVAGKIYLSTNRKSHFLSLFFSQPCTVIKTFFHSPGSQLKMLMSAWTLVNLFHSKFPKNALNLRVSNACSCRRTWHGCLSSSLLKKLQITPP